MINIYCYSHDGKEKSDVYIKKSLEQYFKKSFDETQIFRTKSGKPYIKEKNVHFSVSHSDGIIICAVSCENIGVDIEKKREVKLFKRIANKYFTLDEQKYVDSEGNKAFLDVWVRKESYSKFTSEGINKKLKEVCVLDNKVKGFNIVSFEIDDIYIGALCSEEDSEYTIIRA